VAFYCLYFINQNTGYCGGTNGNIYKTTNGGINFSTQTPPVNAGIRKLQFTSNDTGYAIAYIDGNNMFCLKTTTGGGVFISQVSTSVPDNFFLSQNFPNPFNPSTKFTYDLKVKTVVELSVFDVTGRKIAELFNGEQSLGKYESVFDASLYGLTSGIYFYRLKTNEFTETKKMVLVK
jgi:hypothetical protein